MNQSSTNSQTYDIEENQLANSNSDNDEISVYQPDDMDELQSISVKLPPQIDIDSIITKLLNKPKNRNPKIPNEFFLYRTALSKELKAKNYKIKMTILSSIASKSWSKESCEVKAAFRKIAREIEEQYLNERRMERSIIPNSTDFTTNPTNSINSKSTKKKKISRNKKQRKSEPSDPVNNDISGSMETSTGIGDIGNVTITIPTIPTPTIPTIPTIPEVVTPEYQCSPNQDFTLVEDDNSYNQSQNMYLQQDMVYYYPDNILIDNFPISTYSSVTSSPASAQWSIPSSPLIPSPLFPTNITNIINGEPSNFSTPLTYEIENNNMNYYPQFYEQTIRRQFYLG